MENNIFKEIARELKTLHNTAVQYIKLGKLDDAKKLYQRAASISHLTSYPEGVAMSMFSLSNLESLRQDYEMALDYAVLSMDHYSEESDKENVKRLINKLSLQLVKEGIDLEGKGQLEEALYLFLQALPYLRGKRKEAVEFEVDLLRREIGNE